ncbi:murein hydrolase activator EnvC family protein [Microbacterium esteraromaticum]|uniref:murein hydrolase activator EnvC family protein n=1 Tax=Microbacterium esteraromaticum TaxID=57043 RepID=UPI00211AAFB8|nr:M23 family metallopeptidase [Microbacterium esteraromaticum]
MLSLPLRPAGRDAHAPRQRLRRSLATAVIGIMSMAAALGAPIQAVSADAVTRSADAASAAPGYPWSWPHTGPRLVIEPFRAPAHDYGPGHRGVDITAPIGTAVHAPAAGVVAFQGVVVDRPLLTIDHGSGYVSTFEPVASELSAGATVQAGDVIGMVDIGGHAPRGTMHIGVRVEGVYLNPHPLFGEIPRAILLPCCSD